MIGKKINTYVIARAMHFRPKQSPHSDGDNVAARNQNTPRSNIILLLFLFLLISACSASTPQSSTPQVVSVYSSSATQPWLTELYNCATESSAIIRLSDSISDANIRLQIGEPEFLSTFAYQIDSEEILVVTNRQSPIRNLTLDEVRALFEGLGDSSVQVWVYSSDADVQKVFDQFVMKGGSVASSAKVAVSPQQMSDVLINQPNSVGILPKHWKAGDSRFVYTIPNVPVLAITQSEPNGVINQLIGCLQK